MGATGQVITRVLKLAVATALLLTSPPPASALADPADVGRFHGVWIGSKLSVEKQMQGPAVTASDIGVTIRATESGFEITWKDLYRSSREWIVARFVAASEPGRFDVAFVDPPLRRDEALWAWMDGAQLVVQLVSVGEDRKERMRRYALSVTDNRMTFGYMLSRGGEILSSMTGSLSRAKVVL